MKNSLTSALKISFTFLFAFCISGVFAQTVLRINNTTIPGDYEDLGDDGFGPESVGTVTGDLVAIMDGVAANTETDACEPLTNGDDVSGNVALIDRGSCNFVDKVLNAQMAGAIAAIICNDAAQGSDDGRGGIVNMTAPDGSEDPTISSIFLTLEFCDQIKAEMANGTVNVTLTDEFNLRGSSIARNKNTPLNQVQPFFVTFFHANRSELAFENVHLTCEITDPAGNITTIDTLMATVDTLPPGFSWRNTLSTPYIPTMVGEYSARFYNNGEDIINYIDGVNEEVRTFTISEEEVFRNDAATESGTGVYIAGEWAYGSIFPITNAADALSATFAFSSPSNIVNETVNIILYKLDPNGDGNIDEDGDFAFGGANSAETSIDNIVGFESYTVSADDEDGELITVALVDINTGTTPILDAASEYLLLLEYTGSDTMFISTTPDDRFSPSVALVESDGSVSGHGGGIGRNGSADWFFNEGFFPPVIRLNTSIILDGTNLPQLEDSQVTLMPNPASETVNIALDLNEAAETVQIHLLDIMGRTIQSEVHNNVKDQVFSMDVSKLVSGTYFVSVITDEGRKALKLTVK